VGGYIESCAERPIIPLVLAYRALQYLATVVIYIDHRKHSVISTPNNSSMLCEIGWDLQYVCVSGARFAKCYLVCAVSSKF